MKQFPAKVLAVKHRESKKGSRFVRLVLDVQQSVDFIDVPESSAPLFFSSLEGKYIIAALHFKERRDGVEYPILRFVAEHPELNDLMAFTPSPAQAAIIDAIASEPNLSIRGEARAGAAKTSTVVLAAQNIGLQFSPLALAFNKKNAVELGEKLPSHFETGTLNALGHRAWGRRLSKRLNVDMDKMHKLCKTLGIPAEGEVFIETLQLARGAKSAGLVPATAGSMFKGLVPDTSAEWDAIAESKGFTSYEEESVDYARKLLQLSIDRAWQGDIDFDDQIYMSVLFGGTYAQYHTVIVDEAQDLSPLNHIQVEKLCKTRCIMIGDPFQAIYGFRGADGASMDNLQSRLEKKGLRFKTLPLSKSFRVPKMISARQLDHVPDFGSMDFLPEGNVEFWPQASLSSVGDSQDEGWRGEPESSAWSLDAIPSTGVVLCRNNAPLIALAFAMIKRKRPVKILGRDFGAMLGNLLLKITGKEKTIPIADCYKMIDDWKQKELAKAGDSESKVDLINDKFETLHVLLESAEDLPNMNNQKAAEFIRDLFSDKEDDFKTTFASIHRSKGLEWDWVMMLDPHRIPSFQAERAARLGYPGPLVQENNLRYVGETRAKHTLVLAKLEDCLEMGE